MIQDPLLMKAVSRILQRSEKQQDLIKILNTFVDVGVISQLDNLNNQIIYGRRGTGKTHVFKVLATRIKETKNNCVIYIDARTLGSTQQFSDPQIAIKQRCISLFRDLLGEVYNSLLEYVVENPPELANEALKVLDELSRISTEPIKQYAEGMVTVRRLEAQTENGSVGVNLNKDGPGVALGLQDGQSNEDEQTVSYRVNNEDKVIFSELNAFVKKIIDITNVTLYLLIDEWSSLPFEIQPYFAEFLKRGFLINPNVVIKIAALEYRSNFGIRKENDMLGFEVGCDISTALDIDDYFVYDRSPDSVTNSFSDMLFKHIKAELPDDYFEHNYKVGSGTDLASRIFTHKSVFIELVRASEGVARDLINIFTSAYFDAHRRGRDNIDRQAIVESARQWFEKDKSHNLDEGLHRVLRKIVDEVIGTKKARSFLLPRELERHDTIQRLFDSRVLHLMRRGYSDKDNPGVRHNIYTLDYGTYVDLLGTSKQPQLELVFQEVLEKSDEIVVPFDDKRIIRRIILTPDILE